MPTFNFLGNIATSAAASATVAVTVPASQSAVWVIATCWNTSDLLATGTATLGGASMGSPKSVISTAGGRETYLWEKLAPGAGAASVVVTPSAAAYLDVQVISASGTDATTPLDLANLQKTDTNFATTPINNAVTVGAGYGTLAYCALRINGAATLSVTAGNGMTAVGTPPAGSFAHSQVATGGVVTNSGWSWTGGSAGNDQVVAFVVPVKPAAAPAGPTISAQPSNATVTTPTAASFSVTAAASGGGTLSYQWQRSTNGGSTWSNVTTGSGGTTASYTTGATAVTGGTDNNADQYRCVVTETGGTNAGSTNSNAAVLTVNSGGGGGRIFRQHVGGALTGIGSTGPFYSNPLN